MARKAYSVGISESSSLSSEVQAEITELEEKKQSLIDREKSQDQIDVIDIRIRSLKGEPRDNKGRDKNLHPLVQQDLVDD